MALAAQGFTDPRPTGAPNLRHLRRVVARTGLIQMDSVNVLQRAHYLPLFSRLGGYPTELLDRAVYRAPRFLFEYWGHAASLVPVALQPFLRWRMRQAREQAWGGMRQVVEAQPDLVAWVLDEVRDRGPVTAAEIERDAQSGRLWDKQEWGWNWTAAKAALEWLFWSGEVAAADRNSAWARRYDLPERVLPAAVLAVPTPTDAEAYRELVRVAARAFGVATEFDLRDYFRLPVAAARVAVRELVEEGELLPVAVQDWRHTGYLHRDARPVRTVRAATLVSPFDPLVWERDRTSRLFDFDYRIGIYTPAESRVFGYYSLPFLLGDALVARVDLKADRRAGTLLVPGAWIEPGRPVGEVAEALAGNLVELAAWLGLDRIGRPGQGGLARPLTEALRATAGSTVGA